MMNNNQLNNGIWDLIAIIKTKNYKFIEEGFKIEYPISNLIDPLKNNNIF